MSAVTVMDVSRFNAALLDLRSVIGVEMGEQLLREEAAQLIKTTIWISNRKTTQGSKLGTTGKAIREAVVKRAITATMNPCTADNFRVPWMKTVIGRLNQSGDLDKANRFFATRKSGRFRGAKAVSFSRDHHKSNIRQSDGRTNFTNYRIIAGMDHVKLANYIREQQSHVGFNFAGFLPAAANLGLKLPAWVSRHGGAPGSFSATLGAGGVQSIQFINAASKGEGLKSSFRDAVISRGRTMAMKAGRILNGHATNLGFVVLNKGWYDLRTYKASEESRRAFTPDGME